MRILFVYTPFTIEHLRRDKMGAKSARLHPNKMTPTEEVWETEHSKGASQKPGSRNSWQYAAANRRHRLYPSHGIY